MARYGPGSVGFVLIGGRNVRSRLATMRMKTMTETEDTRPLGSAWETPTAIGVRRNELEQTGWYDDAAGQVNASLADLEQTAQVVCVAPTGNTIGARIEAFRGVFASTWERIIERAGLTKANATYTVTGAREDAQILHALAEETAASGNTEGADSQDHGASTTQGAIGYLHVTALTLGGYTDVAVTVRHSADDVTYADLVTFATVTAAPAAERVTVAGTVNRYTAMAWAFTGSGTGKV